MSESKNLRIVGDSNQGWIVQIKVLGFWTDLTDLVPTYNEAVDKLNNFIDKGYG